ncbi:MAG: MFS transporter [Alphaproteobacteria bacterium]
MFNLSYENRLKNAHNILMWGRFFNLLMFTLPVITLIYQNKGLTLGDFFLFQGIFAIAMFVLEIPTGYLGDIFSRKKIMIFSIVSYLTGYFFFYFMSGFFPILTGEMFLSLGCALYSGTSEAYLYDVLKKQKMEDCYIKIQGRLETMSAFGIAAATFFGGIIYSKFGTDFIILMDISAVTIALVLMFFLPELNDDLRQIETGISRWRDIINIVIYASKHHEIKWLMIFPAFFGTGTSILFWSLQPLMDISGISVSIFGFIVASNQIFRAFFAKFSHYLFSTLKTNKFAVVLFIILIIGFLSANLVCLVSNKIILFTLLILIGMAAGSQIALRLVTSSMVNNRIKSDERATVLSVKEMFFRIFSGLSMMTLKPLLDNAGVQITFMIATVFVLLAIYPLIRLIKLKI